MEEHIRRELAWVGDAVLALIAREWILDQQDILERDRTECFVSLTSNQFLSQFGEPTTIEASIGKRYQNDGLQSTRVWFESELVPVFKKSRTNRMKASKGQKKR
jgi:dsRNA-specific ribonuclease